MAMKKSPNDYKSCPKWFHEKNDSFCQLYKNCLRMWETWANQMSPKALKSCPKSNKSPNLVTLIWALWWHLWQTNQLEYLFLLGCSSVYDSVLCWPPTEANTTLSIPCSLALHKVAEDGGHPISHEGKAPLIKARSDNRDSASARD